MSELALISLPSTKGLNIGVGEIHNILLIYAVTYQIFEKRYSFE